MLVASPPCKVFSILENLRKQPRPESEYKEGREMLKIAIEACKKQHEDGDYFLFEHPRSASSWEEPVVKELMAMDGIPYRGRGK